MLIPDTHRLKLRFRIDADTPDEFMDEWIQLKNICETTLINKEYIVNEMLSYCKLESVRKLPYLNRAEGEIGGDNNNINKQMRFRKDWRIRAWEDNNIVLDNITNTSTEQWTLNELNDIIRGFCIYANNYCNIRNSVSECIEVEYDDSLEE